jgi:uncharacterized protein
LANVPWSLREEDVLLSVRVTPKSSRDEIGGIEDLADGRAVLKVRVRAAPEDGKANEAVIRMLAKALRIRTSAVELEGGTASRVKTLRLEGDPENLIAGLARLCGHA